MAAAAGAAASRGRSPELKVLLIGDSAVGKSSILLRHVEDEFDEDQGATIGMDFRQREMTVDGVGVTLTLWDTAGQERYRCLTSNYYRGTHGVCLVYDVGRRETFENLESWLAEARRSVSSQDVVMLLVANKMDLAEHAVPRADAERFAERNGLLFLECSAKTHTGITQVFEELTRKILEVPTLWDPAAQRAAAAAAATPSVNVTGSAGDSAAQQPACGC